MVGRAVGREGSQKAAAPIIIHHSADYRDIPAAFSPLSPRYSTRRRPRVPREVTRTSGKEVSRPTNRPTPDTADFLFSLFFFSFFFFYLRLFWTNGHEMGEKRLSA